MEKNNVSLVPLYNLCCSCGVCRGVCPIDAISYSVDKLGFNRPFITNNCINCGLCLKCCPGVNLFKSFQKEIISAKYGYSLDTNIRFNSASGGLLTELLCYLVENKIIDYVTIVKKFEKESFPKVIITNDIRTIKSGKTSKYCPLDFSSVIKSIQKCTGRVAIVGVPCTLKAIRQYAAKNKTFGMKVVFYFSLFCNHVPSYHAVDYLASNNNIDKYDSLLFRGNGWPGFFQFYYNGKKIKQIPYRVAMKKGVGRFFKNIRCELCDDPFGDFADASFGDAYFCEQEEQGQTLVIIRNKEIENIVDSMNGVKIQLSNVDDTKTISYFYRKLIQRHCSTTEFSYYLNKLGHGKFFTADKCIKPKLLSIIKQRKNFILCSIGKYRCLWRFLYWYADK